MMQSSKTRSPLAPAQDGLDSRGRGRNRSRGPWLNAAGRVRHFLAREQSGSVISEFAMVMPFFVMLLFGIMLVALVLHADMTLSQAMRDGARFAIVRGAASDTPATAQDIKDAAKQAASLLDQNHLTVDVSWNPDNNPGSLVTVNGTYIFAFNVPGIGEYPVTLNGSSVLTIHN